MHAQVVVADAEHMEVGHKDLLSVLYLAFTSFRVVSLETVGQQSSSKLEYGVTICL